MRRELNEIRRTIIFAVILIIIINVATYISYINEDDQHTAFLVKDIVSHLVN